MNYSRGNRVFYDTETGKVLWLTSEVWESTIPVPHDEIKGDIQYIDFEVKSYDPMKSYIASINPETKEPIFELFPVPEPTEEQLKIKELEENILLLQTDAQVGGIL